MAALIVVILVTRFAQFEGNVMFLGDQGRDASIVRNLATFENLPFIGAPSSIGQVYLGPFYYYLIAPFLPLFGWNPMGLAFGVALFSLIGSFFAVKITVKHFGLAVGMVFLTLIAFSESLINLARFSWNPNLLPYFSFATLYFFWAWMKERSMRNGILFGLFYGLSMQLHYLSVFLIPPFLIFFVMKLRNTSSMQKRVELLRKLMFPGGIFLVTMIPLIVFDIRHSFINSTQLLKLITQGGLSGENTSYVIKLGETIRGLFLTGISLDLSPMMATVLFIVLVVLTFFVAKRLKSEFFTLHAIVVLTYVLGFAYLGSPRLAHYYVPIYLSFYLVIATLPSLIMQKYVRGFTTVAVLGLIVGLTIPHYQFLSAQPNNQIDIAREFADSFQPYITKNSRIQIVTVPYTESHGHYRYFLEVAGNTLIAEDSSEQADELFVMCFQECIPQDDPQWQIAAFTNKQVVEHWEVRNVTIYKIVHGPTQ